MNGALIPLAHLALWCPYCDDMVSPERCIDEGLPLILKCRKCQRSIAHTVPDNDPEVVADVVARMKQQGPPPS